jgi:hypothetical protein
MGAAFVWGESFGGPACEYQLQGMTHSVAGNGYLPRDGPSRSDDAAQMFTPPSTAY